VILAPYYRRFDLPWEDTPEAHQRFRRVMLTCLAVVMVVAAIVPWIPKPKVEPGVSQVPERLARLMIQEKPKPPPPPPPPVEEEKPKEEPKPVPPEQRVEEARKKAEKRLANVSSALADLQRNFPVDQPADTRNLTKGAVSADARSDRSLIGTKATTGSGGVAAASSTAGFGGGAGALGTHSAGTVNSTVAAISGSEKTGQSADGSNKRSQEGFEQEFDRHKGALYAIYTRALRERPELQGKLVLEVTVAPSGEVTACRVVSSELKDEDLERKIVTRVKAIRFPAGKFSTTTFTKPIEFFPG
jgi:protein TonB